MAQRVSKPAWAPKTKFCIKNTVNIRATINMVDRIAVWSTIANPGRLNRPCDTLSFFFPLLPPFPDVGRDSYFSAFYSVLPAYAVCLALALPGFIVLAAATFVPEVAKC
jgi:hypothetical protein